jgi:hypothetical protein
LIEKQVQRQAGERTRTGRGRSKLRNEGMDCLLHAFEQGEKRGTGTCAAFQKLGYAEEERNKWQEEIDNGRREIPCQGRRERATNVR